MGLEYYSSHKTEDSALAFLDWLNINIADESILIKINDHEIKEGMKGYFELWLDFVEGGLKPDRSLRSDCKYYYESFLEDLYFHWTDSGEVDRDMFQLYETEESWFELVVYDDVLVFSHLTENLNNWKACDIQWILKTDSFDEVLSLIQSNQILAIARNTIDD
tara:strand:+ start:37 stop:525 length:489 start_codon:yes stop_codon:yes gene_type:complete